MSVHLASCPTCGQEVSLATARELRVSVRVHAYRAACASNRWFVTVDARVTEDVAAQLLGKAAGTLRNWRAGACPLRFHKVRGRVTYALRDLAEFVEEESARVVIQAHETTSSRPPPTGE